MRPFVAFVGSSAFLLGLAVGSLGLISGCGSGQPSTGAQVAVDQKEQEDLQGRMREFMANKKASRTAKKSP